MPDPHGLIGASEEAQRAAVIAEARTWLGTPWQHAADVKGAGVDCAMFMVRVWVDLGLVEPFDPRPYAYDWFRHRSEEMFLGFVGDRAKALAGPEDAKPGDVAIWRHGRTFSHGAIVVNWPIVIHASAPDGIVVETDITGSPLQFGRRGLEREVRFYSYWGRA